MSSGSKFSQNFKGSKVSSKSAFTTSYKIRVSAELSFLSLTLFSQKVKNFLKKNKSSNRFLYSHAVGRDSWVQTAQKSFFLDILFMDSSLINMDFFFNNYYFFRSGFKTAEWKTSVSVRQPSGQSTLISLPSWFNNLQLNKLELGPFPINSAMLVSKNITEQFLIFPCFAIICIMNFSFTTLAGGLCKDHRE